MTRAQVVVVRRSELQRLPGRVAQAGGEARYLEGFAHGLVTTIIDANIAPGTGAETHRHPYAEVFVVSEGSGRYFVGETFVDAEPGDFVLIPSGAWHSFLNPGRTVLRHVAIHEHPSLVIERRTQAE